VSDHVTRGFKISNRSGIPQWEDPGSVYFITCSVHEDFHHDLTKANLGSVVSGCLQHDHGVRYELETYVVMPTHFHVLLLPLVRDNGFVPLSEIMQSLKGASSHAINKMLERRGSVWLPRSHTRLVRSEREHTNKWWYIRRNPVRAGLVDVPEKWPWLWPQPD
jgi:REP element-mobilizing transposase RayT